MKVIIYGASQHGLFILYAAKYHKNLQLLGFIDDDQKLHGQMFKGIPVLGGNSILPKLIKEGLEGVLLGVGDNACRGAIADEAKKLGLQLPKIIHPTAITSEAIIGEGAVIMAGAITTPNPIIGNNVYIGPGAIVNHDAVIEKNVLLCSGSLIGARVHIKEGAWIGQSATVMTGSIRVGKNSIVGAGSVVTREVPDNVVVAGVPAKVIHGK